MKIAHVTPWYHPAAFYGGPPESAHQLNRHLAKAGCEVRVLTTNANGPIDLVLEAERELTLEPRLQVRYCARRLSDVAPTLFALLPQYTAWCDVLHINMVFSSPTIPALLAASVAGKPVVWSARGALQSWETMRRPRLKNVWKKACRVTSPRRTVVHVTSEEERRQTTISMPGFRTALISNGVEVPLTLQRSPREHCLRLLFLGRIHPIKGIENLLDACALLMRRYKVSFSLKIAGSGPSEYVATIRRRIAELDLMNEVVLLGHVSPQRRESLFGEVDILVAPSFTENFGLTIAEALAHGVPVVAGEGTPWRGLVEHDAGLWVSNSPESLAEAIARCSERRLTDLGDRGRAWMERDFSWTRVTREMCGLYKQLLLEPI